MTTLAEHIIVAGAENRPPMLEKSMYDSWASRIRLFIKGKKHGRMMLDSIDNGPLVYPTVGKNGQTRPKKYSELTEAQQLQDDCDVQETNIILHGLPPDVLYNLFDKFAPVLVQVNTKFLNALSSKWSKFVTDVKLAKSLYTTNYDQLYAYLSQHVRHVNEVHINCERYPDSLAFVANSLTLYNPSQSPQHSGYSMYPPPQQFTPVYAAPISSSTSNSTKFPQMDSSLVVPMFQQGEDLIECINKAMAFQSAVASRMVESLFNKFKEDKFRVILVQETDELILQRPKNTTWFKEKLMLVEAREAGQILDEEQLAFLADPGTVRFRNDQVAKIMGYGDYQQGNVIISKVYYVEGLSHNLFFVGQFCDANLEVAFPKNTFFIRNLEGVDLLSGSRDTNLYTISLDDMLKTSPICLLSKASKTKSWLWHRRLLHLNFGTLNNLAKDGLARGIPKLKFQKDHLCSTCVLGKIKKSSHQSKAEDTNQEKLYLLHMDLCGPMHVESINGKKYILVIVDDYSGFTWVKFLRSKDEAPDAIIKCIKNIQVRLNATVRNVRTDNGAGFVNRTLRDFYENVSILHQTSVARTP
ncbi:retrovirus-related pol polyprotein from transposon TNT 1-94 [Tanacetum coccineum]